MGTSGAIQVQDFALPERYELLRWIANGGMASVWCATDHRLGRRVAIKVLSQSYTNDDGAVRQFKREARAAARLSGHPHVVSIYDVGATSSADTGAAGRPFIVMKHLPGGTVADALRVGAVDREHAVSWIHQAAAAIDYAHAHGIVHRDIKPGNLLLDRDQSLHVADFGIARLGTEDTLAGDGQVIGTAAYISPEQVLGRGATDASDHYSLAVVAYELLVGERPFSAEQASEHARQHIEADPPRASLRNRTLPRRIDAVLAKGLAKRPEERWASAAAFADAVERAMFAKIERAPQPRPVPAPATAAARRPAAAVRTATGQAPRFMRPAAQQSEPVYGHTGGRRRVLALGALAAAAFAVGIAAGASDHGSTQNAKEAARIHPATARAKPHHPRVTTVRRSRPPMATGTPAASTTAAPTATTLEARGHQLMIDGNYTEALPTLRQAVAAADPASPTYAYALYDLGRSLRLSGNPRAAVPILFRRLQIPNQTGLVRVQLQLALQAIGLREMHASAASTGPGRGDRHGKHPTGNQGD